MSESLLAVWSGWLAPETQPFYLPAALATGMPTESASLTSELRDTFAVYRLAKDLRAVWLSQKVFAGLPKATRSTLVRAQVSCGRAAVATVRSWSSVLDSDDLRKQADGHRFVWWPNIVALAPATILGRVVSAGPGTSRHAEVRESLWRRCAGVLPGARSIAGTFPTGSGANCSGTVMAAAGVADSVDAWMLQEPFDSWLKENTTRGGSDHVAGTVLVWRDRDDIARHAAVTIGDGWCLEKPSQSWMTRAGWSGPRHHSPNAGERVALATAPDDLKHSAVQRITEPLEGVA
ncbi:MAG: hypothetical protein M3Y77_02835 [Actinomycetota bacterium]|nr:hypothetical protein [Actinomycetota bacterium]